MALRIRKNGRVLCAAMHRAKKGDTYINDQLHYEMSVIHKILATEPMTRHKEKGEWWWVGNIPDEIDIDEFYLS